jgi:hypothetical protein
LSSFTGDTKEVESWIFFTCSEHAAMIALKETRLARTLYLKVGIPVMLLQNINLHAGWVNGTIPTIFTINDNNIGIKKEIDRKLQRYCVQRVSRTVPRTNYARNQFLSSLLLLVPSTKLSQQRLTVWPYIWKTCWIIDSCTLPCPEFVVQKIYFSSA